MYESIKHPCWPIRNPVIFPMQRSFVRRLFTSIHERVDRAPYFKQPEIVHINNAHRSTAQIALYWKN